MTEVVALTILAGWLAGWLPASRMAYQRMRPWTEPLSCDTPHTCATGHRHSSCYRRYGLIDTNAEAAAFAILQGLIWPLVLPWLLLCKIAAGGAKELPAERDARIERMERELDIGS